MKKHVLMASLAVCSTVLAGTAFAQDGSFKDVPNDHWSYAAIEKLTSLNPKVFIGDPDGMFRGKRNLTRYEIGRDHRPPAREHRFHVRQEGRYSHRRRRGS